MNKWRLFALIALVPIGILVFFIFRGDDYSLAMLKTQDGYVIDIRVPYFWEISQPVSCRMVKNQEIIFPLRGIGVTQDAHAFEFTLIENEDGLIAVIKKTKPYVILAIYDLKNQKMWPSSEGWEQDHAIGQKLLHRLDPRRKGFVLGSLE